MEKRKIEELIVGADGLTRWAVLCTDQEKLGKIVLIKRTLQYLIPLNVRNVILTTQFQKETNTEEVTSDK